MVTTLTRLVLLYDFLLSYYHPLHLTAAAHLSGSHQVVLCPPATAPAVCGSSSMAFAAAGAAAAGGGPSAAATGARNFRDGRQQHAQVIAHICV